MPKAVIAILSVLGIGGGFGALIASGYALGFWQAESDRQDVAEFLSHAPSGQQAWVEDGVIEPDEHRASVDATLACLDRAGIPHSDPVLSSEGYRERWLYEVGPFDELEDGLASYYACYEEYHQAVAALLALQDGAAPGEREQRRQVAVECAVNRGLTVESTADLDALMRSEDSGVASIAAKCLVLGLRGIDLFQSEGR